MVPFERYTSIGSFNNGYAVVTGYKEGKVRDMVIDTKGREVFVCSGDDGSAISSRFSEGLARLSLRYPADRIKKNQSERFEVFIDTSGNIVFADSAAGLMHNFASGRAFVHVEKGYYLIDRAFRQVGADTFSRVANGCFKGNYAIVEKGNRMGIIDTNGAFVVALKYAHIQEDGPQDGFFFFREPGQEQEYFGVGTLAGTEILRPVMQKFDRSGFHNGLLKAVIDDRFTYIDKSGHIVWQQRPSKPAQLKSRNIDYMERGHFRAYAKPNKEDLGGFATSRNYPKRVKRGDKFPPGQLAVIVAADETDTIGEFEKARKVYVVNTTKETKMFEAQDSRLTMKVQARNAEGLWQDIEYLPNSWCGNSYHTLTLKPGNFWEFRTAVYEGGYTTKFRIALTHLDRANIKRGGKIKELTVYSNEYEGGINPAQFWNKRTYTPQGIMDPYKE